MDVIVSFRVSLVFLAFTLYTSPTFAGNLEGVELCDAHIHRMLAAQAIRAGEEMGQCLKNSNLQSWQCQIYVSQRDRAGSCHLNGMNNRLTDGLLRVEAHAENKFPRKCAEAQPEVYFQGFCSKAGPGKLFNSKTDLTECLYVEHVSGWVQSLYQIMESVKLSPICEATLFENARYAYRDSIQDDSLAPYQNYQNRTINRCLPPERNAALVVWRALSQVSQVYAQPIKDFRRR